MDSLKIRTLFLDFFKKNGHKIVSSSSLIPAQDQTLLFTNAGMNQFKDLFLDKVKRSYTKATSIQKCVRAGGKHNDLDQVGFTSKHLTFFEMMGNFSFGDYFKEKAIKYAWEFLTTELKINAKKMVVSVFETDNESYKIWNKKIGIEKEKIYKLGEKENFWQMGDTGPCGPCTEIHIDFGKDKNCKNENCDPSCDCLRFVEIWNLVFMEFDKQSDGILKPLKQKGVDTGMGFERLCMIMQKKDSVFEIDTFQALIKKIEELTNKKYLDEKYKTSFNVLADHIRSSSLLIADGCMPSNEGRGYVLRKIIRRAALFAQKLSDNKKLFPALSTELVKIMGPIYPELKTNKQLIFDLLINEIEKFHSNLLSGQKILAKYIETNKKEKKNFLSGQQIFKLYDTYGFPPELTGVIAKEQGFTVDTNGFEKEMQKQQSLSGKIQSKKEIEIDIPKGISNHFIGYEKLENKSKIIFAQKKDVFLFIATKQTPFYSESGGQISDNGWITINEKSYPILEVYKQNNTTILKIKAINGEAINIGDIAHSIINYNSRINTSKNHTATHMMQAALIQILGKQVKQAGSFVNDKILRFDFTYNQSLTNKEIERVEKIVNDKIQENIEIKVFNTTLQKAKEVGAMAFFGEKYIEDNVRVVQISDFSTELCGGTHLKNTGQIGCFKILSDTALASGVRRVTAITGPEAIKLMQQNFNIVKKLSEKFKSDREHLFNCIERMQESLDLQSNKIKQLKKQIIKLKIPVWIGQIKDIGILPFLFLEVENLDNRELKQVCIEIDRQKQGLFFILSGKEKINFVCFLSKDFENKLDLRELVKFLNKNIGLKCGGNNTLIQGGGQNIKNLKENIINWIKTN